MVTYLSLTCSWSRTVFISSDAGIKCYFVVWLGIVQLKLLIVSSDTMYIFFLPWSNTTLDVMSHQLITMDNDDSLGGWHFHTHVHLIYYSLEFIEKTSPEYNIVGVVHVNHIKCYVLSSRIIDSAKGYWSWNLCQCLNSLSPNPWEEPPMVAIAFYQCSSDQR